MMEQQKNLELREVSNQDDVLHNTALKLFRARQLLIEKYGKINASYTFFHYLLIFSLFTTDTINYYSHFSQGNAGEEKGGEDSPQNNTRNEHNHDPVSSTSKFDDLLAPPPAVYDIPHPSSKNVKTSINEENGIEILKQPECVYYDQTILKVLLSTFSHQLQHDKNIGTVSTPVTSCGNRTILFENNMTNKITKKNIQTHSDLRVLSKNLHFYSQINGFNDIITTYSSVKSRYNQYLTTLSTLREISLKIKNNLVHFSHVRDQYSYSSELRLLSTIKQRYIDTITACTLFQYAHPSFFPHISYNITYLLQAFIQNHCAESAISVIQHALTSLSLSDKKPRQLRNNHQKKSLKDSEDTGVIGLQDTEDTQSNIPLHVSSALSSQGVNATPSNLGSDGRPLNTITTIPLPALFTSPSDLLSNPLKHQYSSQNDKNIENGANQSHEQNFKIKSYNQQALHPAAGMPSSIPQLNPIVCRMLSLTPINSHKNDKNHQKKNFLGNFDQKINKAMKLERVRDNEDDENDDVESIGYVLQSTIYNNSNTTIEPTTIHNQSSTTLDPTAPPHTTNTLTHPSSLSPSLSPSYFSPFTYPSPHNHQQYDQKSPKSQQLSVLHDTHNTNIKKSHENYNIQSVYTALLDHPHTQKTLISTQITIESLTYQPISQNSRVVTINPQPYQYTNRDNDHYDDDNNNENFIPNISYELSSLFYPPISLSSLLSHQNNNHSLISDMSNSSGSFPAISNSLSVSSDEELITSPDLVDNSSNEAKSGPRYPHLNIKDDDSIQPKNEVIGSFLSTVPLLGSLTREECAIVGAFMESKKYAPNAYIIKQGDLGQGMFILQDGLAKVTRLEEGAKTVIELDTISPGDYFGEGALMSAAPRGASVVATAECTALYLTSQHFHALFDRPDGQGSTLTFAKRGTIRSNAMQTNASGQASSGNHHTSSFARFFGGGNNHAEMEAAGDNLTSVYEVRMPISPNLAKDEKAQKLLHDALKDQVLFIGMENEHKLRAIANMWKITVPKDQIIIRQGDIGDNLYVLESGKVGVYIKSADGRTLRKVDSVSKPGKSFGELALLYNTPRNATVKAKAKTTLWVLDRLTFRRLMRNVTEERLKSYQEFLQSVPLFQPLSNNERSRIAEAIETSTYRDGENIVKEGDRGETMYIILDGVVQVTKLINGKQCTVNTLNKGDFFGERSLLENETRTATVQCVGRVEVAKIDQYAFKLLLGPVTDTLTQRMEESIKRDQHVAQVKTDLVHISDENATRLRQQRVILANQNNDLKLVDLEVIGFLGKGGYGYVELVKHKKTTQTYALKTLYRNHIIRTKSMVNVLNEKKMLQRMDSPYIIHLYATYKDEQRLMFLLEPCLGGELFTLLRARGVFAEKAARFYAASVILALEEIHSHGVVYRDLKPENLLLDNEGFIKVTDFGLSKLIGDTRTFTVCGTPHYLAPEIIQGTGHGKSVDLWCLGVLIYEMLAGRPPFYRPNERGDHMRLYRRITCCDFQPSSMFSEDSWDLIQRLLQFKPSSRLGAGQSGFERLRKHAWFAGIDWNALQQRNLRAPIIPYIRTNEDLTNFKKPAPDYKAGGAAGVAPAAGVDQSWDDEF